jgi:2-phospho-L-lactate guanylyltransferase
VSESPWDVLIPVKRLEAAKTRLGDVDDAHRMRLALSFATDAVTAALAVTAVRRVLVVTEDPLVAAQLSDRGAAIVGETRGPGLNAAIEAGLDALAAAGDARRVAIMTGDLPAVSPDEIAAALAPAAGLRLGVLADAEGTGTVLLTATLAGGGGPPSSGPAVTAAVRPVPRFGPESYARHRAAGHVPLPGDYPGLRRDVDTQADLREARRLGLGAATCATTRALVGS